MPQLRFDTRVQQSLEQVRAGFTRDLFTRLAPPFPPVRVLRFGGCATGDEVHLELNFILARQVWVSVIAADGLTAEAWHFVDVGRELPFFLKSWRHEHRVERDGAGSRIVDSIRYKGPNALVGWLLYPTLWLQFAYRAPIYRRVFGPATAS